MNWPFIARSTIFGLLWAAGVVAAMVWAMDAAPTAWGCWKLGAAGVAAFVFGVFTYVRDPESAWSNTPGAGSVKPAAKLLLLVTVSLGAGACTSTTSELAPPSSHLSSNACREVARLSQDADPRDRALFGMIGKGECW